MWYVASTSELVDYLAGLHELPVLPDIIIVDDLHVYTAQPQTDSPEKTIARLCSLLIDAKNFIELKKKPDETTGVLAAASETNPLNISVYNRYFKHCYQIQKTIPSADEQYELHPVGPHHTEKHAIRFHVRDQIYLKDIMAQKIS